jgi:hypothetical protein
LQADSKAEVCDFDLLASLFSEEDVLRFEVSVDVALCVHVFASFDELPHDT